MAGTREAVWYQWQLKALASVGEEDVDKQDEGQFDQASTLNRGDESHLAPLLVALDFDQAVRTQVAFWQRILRLNDWAIKVTYWPHEALGDSVASVKWNRNNQSATLVLRVPDDVAAVEKQWPEGEAQDYDLSIVHELIHLKCIPMEGEHEWAEEQLCNHMAHALVRLYRGCHQQDPPTPPLVGNPPSQAGGSGSIHGHYL